jgi:spore maturation protein CgeB
MSTHAVRSELVHHDAHDGLDAEIAGPRADDALPALRDLQGFEFGGGAGPNLRIVVLGLSITSSWGNRNALCYRALMRALCDQGHDVLFLERRADFYDSHRDLPRPPYGRTESYATVDELQSRFGGELRRADLVVIGSCTPDSARISDLVEQAAQGVIAFYDFDLARTLACLARGDRDHVPAGTIERYHIYLSTTGGSSLELLETHYGAKMARPLYTSVDPTVHFPQPRELRWDLGFLGSRTSGRCTALERHMLTPARVQPQLRFLMASSQASHELAYPSNITQVPHLCASEQRALYGSLRFALNLTRTDVARAGYAPSARLFEAAACGTPIITDYFHGLETFFAPGREIFISRSSEETIALLRDIDDDRRHAMARRARERVLCSHTAMHRGAQLTSYIYELLGRPALLKR